MRPVFTSALARALMVSLGLAALPVWADGLTCPAGWDRADPTCDPADCTAPMGGGLIRVDRFASVEGVPLSEAFDGLEKVIAADGTPLHDLVGDRVVEVAGLPGLRRDYTGSARGQDVHIALVLVRHAETDILLRAVWTLEHDALLALLVAPSVDNWDPRAAD